jgi:predicted aspartyl protease
VHTPDGRARTIPIVLLSALCFLVATTNARAEVWRHPLWVEGGLPVVDVWIGSRGPWRFVVDTGAEGTTVSRGVAERLALPVLGALEQHTMAGAARLLMVRVSGLRVGRRGPPPIDLSAAVSSLDAMRRVVPDLDGVLGGDALAGFEYLLDYTAGRLLLARGEPLPVFAGDDAVVLPLRFDRQRPIVTWPRTHASAPLPLVVDTGAMSFIVDASEAAGFGCRARTSRAVRLETHSGSREVESCEMNVLRAGSLEVDGLRMVMLAWPRAIDRLDRGLLPASAFGRVYVSRLNGTLTLWKR